MTYIQIKFRVQDSLIKGLVKLIKKEYLLG
jgi:hypothetical protein